MSEISVEELLARSTLPVDLQMTLSGFADEDYGKGVADAIGTNLKLIGAVINLERLDWITIAFDYKGALANLDREFAASLVLQPVAMAPPVRHNGLIKSHIMLDANIFGDFFNSDNPNWPSMQYMLAHECGHVHDHRALDLAFPGTLLEKPIFKNDLSRYLYSVAYGCWSEYAVSRLSAFFFEGQVVYFEDTFMTTFDGLEGRSCYSSCGPRSD